MVFEHLFPEDWLERKYRYAFLLAIIYATLGIVLARLLFAANSGIVSVIFTTLFLIPYLGKLLVKEERRELQERRFTPRHLWRDNKDALLVYLTLFLGVYTAYLLYSFLLPFFGLNLSTVFREQLALEANLRGGAFSIATFTSILLNNWWVLLACFLLSLIVGEGALFFVTWNASSWGTILGYRAVLAALHGGAYSSFVNLLIIILLTTPHILLEGGAYIVAAIAGGVLSDDIVSKRSAMSSFVYFFIAAVVFFVLLYFFYHTFLPGIVASIFSLLTVIGLLYLLSFVFDDPKHKEVFQYNYSLFLVALLLFILGAIVETLVLGNSSLLQKVYWAALGF